MKWLIVALTLLALSFQTKASPQNCTIDSQKTAVLYGNGMLNGKRDRNRSLTFIKNRINSLYDSGFLSMNHSEYIAMPYDLAVNHSEFLPLQINQVLNQRLASEQTDWRKAWKGLQETPEWALEGGELADDLEEAIGNDLRLYDTGDLQNQISLYRRYLETGHRVIVVAHSQGNMYANQVVAAVAQDMPDLVDSIHVVGVATPDRVFYGNYVTLTQDRIIGAVELLFPSTLDPNETDFIRDDFLGHNFLVEYMNNDNASNRINSMLINALNNTPYPQVTIEDSELPNDRLGCDGTIVINDLTVESGVITVDSETTSMAIEGQIDGGIHEVQSVFASLNGVSIDQSEIVFYKDLKTFYINVDGVVEGENSLSITLRDVNGNTIPINQVDSASVPNGYLPNNGATSAELVISQEAATCDIIEGDLSTLNCAMSITITEDENTGAIDGGVLNVAADVDSMTIRGVYQPGVLQQVDSIALQTSVSTQMTLLPDNAFTLQLSNIPEGQSQITISFTDPSGQPVEVFPLEAVDAVDGLLTSDVVASTMSLTVQKEAPPISCSNIPPLYEDPRPWKIVRTGGPANYSTLVRRTEVPIVFQITGDYAHCIASASIEYENTKEIIPLELSYNAQDVLELSGSYIPANYKHIIIMRYLNVVTRAPTSEVIVNELFNQGNETGFGEAVFIRFQPYVPPLPPPVIIP